MRSSLIRLAEGAAETLKATRPAGRPGADKWPGSNNNFLLVQVPRTALATDVQRALKESEAVVDDYSLSNSRTCVTWLTPVTARPIGAKRIPSLLTTYHLRFNSPASAQKAYSVISRRPLFAGYSSPRSVEGPDDSPSSVLFTNADAEEWAGRTLARAAREAERLVKNAPFQPEVEDHIGAEWAIDQGSRNRRVLITGLPVRTAEYQVRNLASGVGGVAEVKIRRVARTNWSNTSAWAVTAASVAQAYQIARKLNQNYFASDRHGHNFLMRAHVQP